MQPPPTQHIPDCSKQWKAVNEIDGPITLEAALGYFVKGKTGAGSEVSGKLLETYIQKAMQSLTKVDFDDFYSCLETATNNWLAKHPEANGMKANLLSKVKSQ